MLLQTGSTGPDVARLAIRLSELGLYQGGAENIYKADIDSAVRAFQTANGLPADGVVGNRTWAALFPDTECPLAGAPLAQRCLALTGTFETSSGFPDCFAGLAGDFDGQGLSFGVLQWNIGQNTLQPMLTQMLANHGDVMNSLFQTNLNAVKTMLASPLAAQFSWAREIQDPVRHSVSEPWHGLFKALGRTAEFQAIEAEHAEAIHRDALQLCHRFGLTTERAVALMFDIRVQNGSIGAETETKIRGDFAAIPASAAAMDVEIAKLQSIANRRAEAAKPAFIEDVRNRKLTIANGSGTVHDLAYDLGRQFGIGLRSFSRT